MSKILINYADITHYAAQQDSCKSATRPGGFDSVIPYNRCDLDEDFKRKNKDILSERKGAGYWLWKPHIILKTMDQCNEGDFIFYTDTVILWLKSVDPIIEVCRGVENGIFLFHTDPLPGNMEKFCTKRDTFVYMGCISEKYTDGLPLHAGMQLYRVCEESRFFVAQYLKYCRDRAILTDDENTCGLNNYPGFKFHRHDQSVLSLLANKYEIHTHRDPTEHGNPYINSNDGYGQIVKHTRRTD